METKSYKSCLFLGAVSLSCYCLLIFRSCSTVQPIFKPHIFLKIKLKNIISTVPWNKTAIYNSSNIVALFFLRLQLHILPCGGKAKNARANGRAIFLFSIKPRMSLGFNQFPLQWVKRALSSGDKRSGLEAGAEGQEWIKFHSPTYFYLVHRDRCIFNSKQQRGALETAVSMRDTSLQFTERHTTEQEYRYFSFILVLPET